MSTDTDVLVVGAGAAGLATALALSQAGRRVMVVERNRNPGREISARSSEVIHAGLYYPPGSLKARLCVEGRDALYDFARENGIAHHAIGKLVVAADESEIEALNAIAARAAANGVQDLVALSANEARALEPNLACTKAYLSPRTGIFDSSAYISALVGHIESKGGEIILNANVTAIESGSAFTVSIESGGSTTPITSRALVLAGGLAASTLGRMVQPKKRDYVAPDIAFARGHYYALQGAAPFARLIYPVPKSAGLGIHFTRDTGGGARFGPDHEWSTDTSDVMTPSAERLARFETSIRKYWPALPEGALVPSYVGIRPKLAREGEPPADFAIHDARHHGHAGLVALYGIESPGLTASLAIGRYVRDLLADPK